MAAVFVSVIGPNLLMHERVSLNDGYRALRWIANLPADRPLVVLVGSSHTQHGIDHELLEAELARRGVNVHVGILAFGGMAPIEQHFYLRSYRALGLKVPDAVLFEVAPTWAFNPVWPIWQNRHSPRMVEMMDWRSTAEALRWTFSIGRADWALDILGLAARDYLGFSVLSARVPFAQVPPQDPTYPLAGQRPSFTQEAYESAKAGPAGPQGAWNELQLSRQQSERMARTAEETGSRLVGFYVVPFVGVRDADQARLCPEHRFCLVPDDALMEELDRYELWYDASHVQAEGRRRFTIWFAGRIADQLRRALPSVPGGR